MNNFNLVLRTYTAMRQMSPDDLALLNTLRALNDVDRQKLIETMSDKPQKKAGKKSAGGGGGGRSAGKSAHASSLRQQISTSGTGSSLTRLPAGVTTEDDSSDTRCQFIRADGNPCKLLPDHNIHHMTTANEYHEFQSASSSTGKSDAQSAAGGS